MWLDEILDHFWRLFPLFLEPQTHSSSSPRLFLIRNSLCVILMLLWKEFSSFSTFPLLSLCLFFFLPVFLPNLHSEIVKYVSWVIDSFSFFLFIQSLFADPVNLSTFMAALLLLPEHASTISVITTSISLSPLALFRKIYLCTFDCAGSLLHGLFSSCVGWRLLSSCGTWASYAVASLVEEHVT